MDGEISSKENVRKLEKIFRDFHLKMVELMKRQTKLLERLNKILEKRKLREIREKIKNM